MQKHRLPDRFILAEDRRGQFIADERDTPLVFHVEIVDEPAAGRGDEVPHVPEDRSYPGNVDSESTSAVIQLEIVRILAGDPADARRLLADVLNVLFRQSDRASLAQAFVGNRGEARPADDDTVAETRRVLDHPLVQTSAECQQKADRDGAPHNSEDGEKRAELLRADVAEQLPENIAKVQHWLSKS